MSELKTLDPALLMSALHPEGSIYCVCAFGSGLTSFRHPHSVADGLGIAAELDSVSGHAGVYHCVGNLGAVPTKGRGREADMVSAHAVWADVDALDYDPLLDYVATASLRGAKAKDAKDAVWRDAGPEERERALASVIERIDGCPLGAPSALVSSGRGYHPYWLLAEPANTPAELDLVRAINRRLAKLLDGDKCWDLARVLKVPGTHNRKDPAAPILARLERFDAARRFALEDLAALLGIPRSGDAVAVDADAPAPKRAPRTGPAKAPLPEIVAAIPEADRIARARAYVSRIPAAVAGQGGHDRTFWVALVATRGFDLPVEIGIGIVAEYSARCDPPWSDAEIRHKCESADRDGKPARGWLLRDRAEEEAEYEIAMARARFCAEAIDAMPSADAVLDADFRADLVTLWIRDSAGYSVVKSRLRDRFPKLDFRAVERGLKADARTQAQAQAQRSASPEFGCPSTMFPDAELGTGAPATMPRGYSCDPIRGISRDVPAGGDGETKPISVCPAPLFVAGRAVDLADGAETTSVRWLRGDGWRSMDVDRGVLCDRRGITGLGKIGFPAHSESAGEIVRYLAEYEHHNLTVLPVRHTASALGWLRDRSGPVGFLAGRTLIPARENAPEVFFQAAGGGEHQIADAIRPAGEYAEWQQAAKIAGKYPRVVIGIYASLGPVLLRALDAQNFSLDWAAETSTGKSTCLRLAASVWGDGRDRSGAGLVRGWDNTRTFCEHLCATMNHMPTFLDDTKRARDVQNVADVIYDHASGTGRGRGAKTGGTQSTSTFTGVLLMTGEAQASRLTKDGGVKARCLSFWGPPFGGVGPEQAADVATISRLTAANYGHAGPEFVRWVIAHRDEVIALRGVRASIIRDLSGRPEALGNSVAGRLAEFVATLAVTGQAAALAGIVEYSPESIDAAWIAAIAGAGDADIARDALDSVIAWAHSHPENFWKIGSSSASIQPHGGWAGRWNEGDNAQYIGFFRPVLEQILDAGGYGHEVIRTWDDRGWLRVQPPHRSIVAEVAGRSCRLVAIESSAWVDVAPETEPF